MLVASGAHIGKLFILHSIGQAKNALHLGSLVSKQIVITVFALEHIRDRLIQDFQQIDTQNEIRFLDIFEGKTFSE